MANFADAFLGARDNAIQRTRQQQDDQNKSALAKLYGDYQAAAQDQRATLLPEIARRGGDAFGLEDRGFRQQENQQRTLAQEAAYALKLSPEMRAQWFESRKGAIAASNPALAGLATMQWDEAAGLPVLEQVAGATGGAKIHSQRVLADGRILNTYADGRTEVTDHVADRQSWFANQPGVDPYIVNENAGVTMVGPGQRAPQPRPQPSNGDPKADAIMQAMNAMAQAGIPDEQIEAFGHQAMAAAGLKPTASGQMPPQAAPVPTGGGLPAPGGGGGASPSGGPVAPPAPTLDRVPIDQYGGGTPNPLRRPVPAPKASEESFGQPQAVTDPVTGTVKMVQFGNRGSQREVPNYTAPPTSRDAKPPTEGERGAAGYLGRMRAAEGLLGEITKGGYTPTVRDHMTAGRGVLQNWAATEDGQKWRQAQEDWVRAKLRKESGAAIPTEEMDREITMYFPQPGDGPGVIAQKAESRKEAEAQLISMAGRALPKDGQAPAANGNTPKRLTYNPETGELE